jgi:hypothetical protein
LRWHESKFRRVQSNKINIRAGNCLRWNSSLNAGQRY